MLYHDREFEYEGVSVHYMGGRAGFPLLLIHESGPGASAIGNWRLILDPLAERCHVYAMDLTGFDRSGRRRREPYFELNFWLSQCRALGDRMPGEKIDIVGHSLSSALALKLAELRAAHSRRVHHRHDDVDFPVNQATARCCAGGFWTRCSPSQIIYFF